MAGNNRTVVTPGGVFSSSSGAVAGGLVGGTYVISISSSEVDSDVILTVTNSSGVVQTITIPTGSGGGGTPGGGDPVVSANITEDNLLILVKQSGDEVTVDLSQLDNEGTDTNDYLVSGTLNGTTLELTVQNQSQVDVDLSSLVTNANIVTNGLTYTETRNNVILTIENNSVTLTSQVIPPDTPTPPPDPEPFNQIDGGSVTIDAPSAPSGGSVTDVSVDNVSATNNQDSDVSNDITVVENTDGTIDLMDIPPGTEEIDVDITITGTDSNGDPFIDSDVEIEVDSFVPFYTITTPPGMLTLDAGQVQNGSADIVSIESDRAIASGVSFTIEHDVIRRRWLAANQTGLTFMNAGFPVMSTEISDTVTIQNVTFYLYDFGFAVSGPLQATVI